MTTEVLKARTADLCFAAGDHPSTGYVVWGVGSFTALAAQAPIWVPLVVSLIAVTVPATANIYRGLVEWRAILAERRDQRRAAERIAALERENERLRGAR